MKEESFHITLTPEQATIITSNRNIYLKTSEYIFQIKIRIFVFEPGSTELTDFFPLGLQIRLNGHHCPLTPRQNSVRPGTIGRRIVSLIDVTRKIQLNPMTPNTFIVNWIPDVNIYVMGIYLVEKLPIDMLLQKLYDKGIRSSGETKNCIINKFGNADPDFATTSYSCSVICSVGRERMQHSAKSTKCNHIQCFDALTFMKLNKNKLIWKCPICNEPFLFDELQIDSYFLEVISSPNLPETCTVIEVLADGTRKVHEEINTTIVLNDSDGENSRTDKQGIENQPTEDNTIVDLNLQAQMQPQQAVTMTIKHSAVDLPMSDIDEPQKKKRIYRELSSTN